MGCTTSTPPDNDYTKKTVITGNNKNKEETTSTSPYITNKTNTNKTITNEGAIIMVKEAAIKIFKNAEIGNCVENTIICQQYDDINDILEDIISSIDCEWNENDETVLHKLLLKIYKENCTSNTITTSSSMNDKTIQSQNEEILILKDDKQCHFVNKILSTIQNDEEKLNKQNEIEVEKERLADLQKEILAQKEEEIFYGRKWEKEENDELKRKMEEYKEPMLSQNNTNTHSIDRCLSLQREFNEYKDKYNELELQNKELMIKLNKSETSQISPLSIPHKKAPKVSFKKAPNISFIDTTKSKKMKSFELTKSIKALLASSPSFKKAPKQWKYKNGMLSIKVIQATYGQYVEVELKGNYNKKEKTKIINNDTKPVWNELFQLFPDNPKKDILTLKIWNKNVWTFDNKIGTVYIPLIDVLNANGNIHKTYDIKGTKCEQKIDLKLKYKEFGN